LKFKKNEGTQGALRIAAHNFPFSKGRFSMKRLFEIAAMVLVAVWLTFAFAAPPQKAGKASPAIKASETNEPVYQFLNPKGIPGPIKVQGLAPRLDTIKGKTIYVVACEAGPQTGPYLYNYLKEHYPDTNWVHIQHNGMGPTDPKTEGEMLKKAQGLIGGQSW
jgi:hypothetical protein